MLKRFLCLIIISSLLYGDIAYPLNRSSSIPDSDFVQAFSTLMQARDKVSVKDASGVWIVGKNWKMRFFDPSAAETPDLDREDELVYAEKINDKLNVQVYFKGLSDADKETIRSFLFNNPNVSTLARMVFGEVADRIEPPHGKIVRREMLKEEEEGLSKFIRGLTPQVSYTAIVDAVVREIKVKVNPKAKDVLKDYIGIFTKRMKLKERRNEILKEKDLFILKKLSELEEDKIYKSIKRVYERTIGEEKRLKVVPPNVIARIVARYEGIMERDVDPSTIISFTWGDTIYFNSDSRLSDFIVYILHEITHLYGGDEKDARKVDKEIIAVLKGVVSLLREEKTKDTEVQGILDSVADVIEYEVLGYELDLHTARLQGLVSGEAFLRHFDLASINPVPDDGATSSSYVREVRKQVTGVIKERKDRELFSEIKSVIKRGESKRIGMRIFWAFMKYIQRLLKEKIEREAEMPEEKEDEEAEPLTPLYEEDVLSYVITKDEAERRLRDVVLNPDAPLFARINDAIMIDIFSETQKIELDAVDKIRPILEKEPIKALQILEELRNSKSVELISEFLKHSDPKVRRIAAQRLFNIARSLAPAEIFNQPNTMKNLLDFINRPEITVQDEDLNAFLQVLMALSSIRYREAIPLFMDIIEKNKSNKIRLFAARALGSIGDTSVIPLVRDRIWNKGDQNSMAISIACLEQVPNDESTSLVVNTFLQTKDKKMKLLCLGALNNMIKRRRISIDVMMPVLDEITEIAGSNKSTAEFNFILGRSASIALQEGREDVIGKIKVKGSVLEIFAMGLIHDTFMDVNDVKRIPNLSKKIGKWTELIEYVQKIRNEIYAGKREYTDIIWKDIAIKMAEIKPEDDLPIGKMWFQRMCLAISYRALLDTWDIGKIEDRDFILELMVLRSSFVGDDELPEGAIGATEAIHGEYVDLDSSLFSTSSTIPGGVDTVWHEATHLLNSMGIADISDISLLGASSHSNIEFYLLSEIFGLPSISDVVDKLKEGISIDKLREEYIAKGLPAEDFGGVKPILEGMAVRDKAEGPLEAFFMVRNIDPKKTKKWKWEDILWKLRKINTEIIDTFTIRGRKQILVHTYLDGARFSGYAHRLGVETGFYDATSIYIELLVRARLTPAQAEFIARSIAKFMTKEKDSIERMVKELAGRHKNIPAGEVDKWLKRFIVEKLKLISLKLGGNINMWINYKELDVLLDRAYSEIKAEIEKEDIKKDIYNKVIKAIGSRKRIFKVVSRGYKKGEKQIVHIGDTEGIKRPVAIYCLLNTRYLEVDIDFGSGEELYAYIDVEDKKIKPVNPDDKRMDLGKVVESLEMGLVLDNNMQIDSPIEKNIGFVRLREIWKKIKGIDWRKYRKIGFYGGILFSITIVSSLLEYPKMGITGIFTAVCAIIGFEFLKRRSILYEDTKIKLSRELRKKLKEGRVTNKGIRKFTRDLNENKLITKAGDIFSIDDFNRLILAYPKERLIDFLIRDLKVNPKVSVKVINYALKILEYKESISAEDLDNIVMPLSVEEVLARLALGQYIIPVRGRISPFAELSELGKFKRIGLGECFIYAKEGINGLYEALWKSYRIGWLKKIPLYVAEETADVIFDIYLSLGKDDGVNEFIKKIVQLDLSNYVTAPTLRHRFIREFKTGGEEIIEKDERVFDAVLDSMGINKGLEFLGNVKEETTDRDLYWTLMAYLGSFETGPNGYIPVEVEDSWQSFNLWKKRIGEVTYDDAQRKFLELYIRYLRNAKGDIPRWGWPFLWLCYYEKDSRMYKAVSDLLKGEDVEALCAKYKLSNTERQQLLYTVPIDGFVALVEIYCKNTAWGNIGIIELEERLKRAMNIAAASDIKQEDLFNKDVDNWLYTFRNIPEGLEEKIKEKLKNEILELVMTRLKEAGTDKVTKADLVHLLDLIYIMRFPSTRERFVDNVSIIDICKILFDYARQAANNDAAIKKLHAKKNLEILPESAQKELEGDKNYLDEFSADLNGANKVLVFTQRHQDTIGLLYWIQKVLKENPDLEVRMVPQKSMWELNSTKEDILAILGKEKGLQDLAGLLKKGRFIVLDNCAPGLSWLKGPERLKVKEEIENADVVLGVGWDNFVSLQGLNRVCYFAFSVDDPIKEELTGYPIGHPVFVKTCGGIPAIKIGRYTLLEYLNSANSEIYKELLSYFGGDKVKLHKWVGGEAVRTRRREVDIMSAGVYTREPLRAFGDCALRDPDTDARIQALDILLNNYEKFGIRTEVGNSVKLGDLEIKIDVPVECYIFPDRPAVVLVKDGKRLILEVFNGGYVRIGDKVYKTIEGAVVNIFDLFTEPAFWVGNSELVEFVGISNISKLLEGKRESPMVHIKDIPQDISRLIPQTKPNYLFSIAKEFLTNPSPYLSLRLHYAIVLFSSPSISQRVKGLEELESLRKTNDKEIMEIIRIKGLRRVTDWINSEIPPVDRDIFSLANFTEEEERILRVLGGGYILRPPLVTMPGQGVSAQFYNLLRNEVKGVGIELVRSNYAEGAGSVLFQDGTRHYLVEGDLVIDLSRDLTSGQMLGAIRLEKNDNRIIQVPVNAGILNYLKVLHHLSHIITERFTDLHGGGSDPLQEFTPNIEDILIIKYMEKLAEKLKDGFFDFKEEAASASSEDQLRNIFVKYGLNYPAGKDFELIKEEISREKDMLSFSDYIEKNDLSSFISVKEFLNILIDYSKVTVKDYMKQLPLNQQLILEGLLSVNADNEINAFLSIASLLAGCHIPKVKLDSDVEIVYGLLIRAGVLNSADKNNILGRIDETLESGEPFSAKAVKVVGTILYRTGIRITQEERRNIEEKVMDMLSGKWLQTLEELLEERLASLEARGVNIKDLRVKLGEIQRFMVREPQHLGKPTQAEPKEDGIEKIESWDNMVSYVKNNNIKRVFCDIDKTILDAPGFITTTPWFREMTEREGLAETIRKWAELEEGVMERGMAHLMEDKIPQIIKTLREMGVEVILYTARRKEDLPRTQKMLSSLGIDGLEIITSKGGTPEDKRDALVEYYKTKGLFKGRKVPTLYIDDTLSNLRAVCGDKRFGHIKGKWYHAPYQKRYDVSPSEFLEAGDKALSAGNAMEALEWYYNAFYVGSRKDMVNQVYDIVSEHIGFEASIEEVFYKFIKDRLNRYKGALEKEKIWIEAKHREEDTALEKKEIVWLSGAPDISSPKFWKGVRRIIVIGSHPHGDHIKGFLDYAKRRLKNIVETRVPEAGEMRTGGTITHSLSNYWGRIGEETIVVFDLGWFPEGFVDPLIQMINPGDREILFIMDPDTERTLNFGHQLQRLKLEGVKLQVLPYDKLLKCPAEKGRVIQIDSYPAYHLDPKVGSSVYMVRSFDTRTHKETQSVGYISELGDTFPEKMEAELLEKLGKLGRIILDGTNLVAEKGEEPLPLTGRPNKIHKYVRELNRGRFLLAHFNTTSIRMGEDADVVAENLDPSIPIVIIGGKDAIEQLRRSYNVPKELDYYTVRGRKVYLVHDVAGFHKKMREKGVLPSLDEVLDKRISGLKKAGWSDEEIKGFVSEWKKAEGQEVKEYKGPRGKVREIEALLWDLRKTRAVVIGSSQFRGDPTRKRYENFKGFQILDAIVDKKDVSILIEGRLHTQGEEGTVLRVLLDNKRKDREIASITGKKKVKAVIDNQWRSGHITFKGLMDLLNRIADQAIVTGNIYETRTYMPVPEETWFSVIPEDDVPGLLQKYGQKSLFNVIDIVKRWNNKEKVSEDEIHFARKIIKIIFEKQDFFKNLRISDAEGLKRELIERLKMAERDVRLKGKVNIKIFIASTSKFIEVLRRELEMDPDKLSELLAVANRFAGFEVGVSYEYGKTIDLVQRRPEEYSENLEKKLNRGYLKELYSMTVKGEIPPDLTLYAQQKGLAGYKAELNELLEDAKGKAESKGGEPFGIWFAELKRYIESQFLRIGMRYTDKVVSHGDLRKELSIFYDVLIESVYNYLQEDMGWKFKDIAIVAGNDYAEGKVLFKDTVRLGILTGSKVDSRYATTLQNKMKGILNKLGIPVEFNDWTEFLHKRIVVSGSKEVEKELKIEIGKAALIKRKGRFSDDLEVLERKGKFNVHTGPGGLDDIELIRMFYNTSVTDEERAVLEETESFLRRYKEEAGYSTGGDRSRAGTLFREIMDNLSFKRTEREFKEEFFRRVSRVFNILQRVMSDEKARPAKSLSFGSINEERDIHKGVFSKAASEGRLISESNPGKYKKYFKFIREVIKGDPELEDRRYVIVEEEAGKPTMFYRDNPFSSVLSHSGKSTNAVYIGLNTIKLAQKSEYREAFRQLLLHENRDIVRSYHMDLEDEIREGIISPRDADNIHKLWNDLLTGERFSAMYNLYLKKAEDERYDEYFLNRIPADIRLVDGGTLYDFKHGDHVDLPDLIRLNIKLFKGGYSPETNVFLLRHCTDRIRYDVYKTIINDIKYLLAVERQEREGILDELRDLDYIRFIEDLFRTCRITHNIPQTVKERIRDYVGLRFKTYTSPDGANVWYSVGGNPDAKRTLVFLHGITVNPRDWRGQITFFEDKFRIVTINLRGFDKSKGVGTKPPHIRNYAEDVEAILKREGIEDAIIVGHSMGGMTSLNMEEIYEDIPVERRRIKGLVLIAATAWNPFKSFLSKMLSALNLDRLLRYLLVHQTRFDSAIWDNPILKYLIKVPLFDLYTTMIINMLVINKDTPPLMRGKIKRSILRSDAEAIRYGFKAIDTHDVRNRLKDIKVPVLWVIGMDDRIVLSEYQEDDAGKVKDCRIERVPGVKHYPHLRYPRRINKAIYMFANSGTYRFSQLVSERIRKRYSVDVSLDELSTELDSIKMRFIPKIRGLERENLGLINDISELVRSCGLETGVADSVMIKAVMLATSQILQRPSVAIPPARPITHDDLERLYDYVVKSV